MTEIEQEIHEAQPDIASAQARFNAARERQRQEKIAIAEVRGRELVAAYAVADAAFKRAQKQVDELHSALDNINGAIDKHGTKRPSPESFPSAEAITTWQDVLAELIARREPVLRKLHDAKVVLARARMEFLQTSGDLQNAKQILLNLQNAGEVERSSIAYV